MSILLVHPGLHHQHLTPTSPSHTCPLLALGSVLLAFQALDTQALPTLSPPTPKPPSLPCSPSSAPGAGRALIHLLTFLLDSGRWAPPRTQACKVGSPRGGQASRCYLCLCRWLKALRRKALPKGLPSLLYSPIPGIPNEGLESSLPTEPQAPSATLISYGAFSHRHFLQWVLLGVPKFPQSISKEETLSEKNILKSL
jgi:hypothetical protein